MISRIGVYTDNPVARMLYAMLCLLIENVHTFTCMPLKFTIYNEISFLVCCFFFVGVASGSGTGSLGVTTQGAGTARVRSAMEAVLVRHLMSPLQQQLDTAGFHNAFINTEMPSQVVLARMELNGMGEY